MSASVFVGNLNYQTTEAELVQFFSVAGNVVSAKIPLDRDSGRSRGFGFVEFDSEEAVEQAIERCNDSELGGRKLRVNKAESKPTRPGGARPRPARPDRGFGSNPMQDSPELDFSREDHSSGHGRRDDWKKLRGKKRTL